jgi:hypothetical protein
MIGIKFMTGTEFFLFATTPFYQRDNEYSFAEGKAVKV